MIATIILLLMMAMGLGMSIAKHGERTNENAWVTLIAGVIQLILFYYAGLFDKFMN